MAAIPQEPDKVVLFDQRRAVVQSLGDEIAQMTPEGIQQVVALLVERVETSDRHVTRVIWAGAARPFFTADDYTVAPPDGRRGTRGKAADALGWYAAEPRTRIVAIDG